MEHFSTERLIARDWTTADADSAFASYGREEVARWLGAPPRRPAASVEAMRAAWNGRSPRMRGSRSTGCGRWSCAARAP
jgi:ribosomal-protein-alanine N-acetyltransferase